MMCIGFCKDSGRVVSGMLYAGRELFPAPLISHCKLTTNKSDFSEGPDTSKQTEGYVFLEDFYDSKSRIRRGRIYLANQSQPMPWRASNGAVLGRFDTYNRSSIWVSYYKDGKRPIYVLLGDKARFTHWKLVDLELLVTGEELLTLKAISSFAVLPELLDSEIPHDDLTLIQKIMNQVVDEAHTASADSVVDCCREAASAVIGSYVGEPTKDLGQLVTVLGQDPFKKELAQNSAAIINRFHPRRKSSELRSKGLRRISDEDAQLAVQCLGVILVEIGWARW